MFEAFISRHAVLRGGEGAISIGDTMGQAAASPTDVGVFATFLYWAANKGWWTTGFRCAFSPPNTTRIYTCAEGTH
ncbi:hypothetical protein GW916_10535 [bacterium]|nr:hypothetical protein [bacterium]